jgi:pimeloyl-ACP methyl ester carboxylesterase
VSRFTGDVVEIQTSAGKSFAAAKLHNGSHAVVYLGGNAEDVSLSIPKLAEAFPDHAIYALHYRGFGGSSGEPSESALFSDAIALFDQVRGSHEHIRVVGSSLGSGVAIYLASVRPVEQLVLVTPYDSLLDLIAMKLPLLPVRLLLEDKFESWRYAPQVSAPTLVLIAERDEVVPRESTDLLLSRFPSGVARVIVVHDATHNSIYKDRDYVSFIRSSLQ